tara:strand:- start:5368 stop:6228 length:861 start_codon:yes stop_codon:yes gene_type:complete
MNIDIKQLREEGILAVPQMIDPKLIDDLKTEVDEVFDENDSTKLGAAIHVAALKPEHLTTYGEERAEIEKEYPDFYLNETHFSKGLPYYRNLTNGRSILQPFINLPTTCKILENYPFHEISSQYFEKKSKLGFTKVRRHFVNNLPRFDTNYFHIDDNCKDLLKGVMFLNDVDMDGGPFVFVPGSQNNPVPSSEGTKWSRTDEEVEEYYGKDAIVYATAKKGDVVFANTVGIHKGNKPISQDRNIFFFNFVLEPEYNGTGSKLKLKRENYNQLDSQQKDFVEFFEII